MIGLIDRLDAVRHVGVSADILAVVPAHRIRRMAQEGRRLTAQNLEQMRPGRRHATLAAFLLEMEMALTDAAIGMFEVLVGKTMRRAQPAREVRLHEETTSMTSVLGFFASVGEALATAKEKARLVDDAVSAVTTWDELARATASAKVLSGMGNSDNLIPFFRDQHARVRKFSAPFLLAFTFEGSGQRAELDGKAPLTETADNRTALRSRCSTEKPTAQTAGSSPGSAGIRSYAGAHRAMPRSGWSRVAESRMCRWARRDHREA